MSRLERADWWTVRRAQNRKPSTYKCPLCGYRLHAMTPHVSGTSLSAQARYAAGVREMTIRALVRGDARTISPQLRDTITAVYDAWWDKRAPGRTRAERGAATAARKRAIAGNWCAAAALDDDLLDLPGYQPRQGWMPATGTGTPLTSRPRMVASPEIWS